MLKGAQKKMIVIRTHDSRMFEEAYFVMRRDAVGHDPNHEDMLWEANRIIERSLTPRTSAGDRLPPFGQSKPGRWLRRIVWFLAGGLCGGGAVGLLWAFL